MQKVSLDLYQKFSCLAGSCPSTCCSGWRIFVDAKDFKRFQHLLPLWLSEDILSHIIEKDGMYYFENRPNGDCAMLEEDGLCRIQKNTSEETLCNTCRKYPRLFGKNNEKVFLSMAASCPVVSNYLLSESVRWVIEENGREEVMSFWQLPLLEKDKAYYLKQERIVSKYPWNETDFLKQFPNLVKMSDGILSVLVSSTECPYLPGSFDYYEKNWQIDELKRDITAFWKENPVSFRLLAGNYLSYRMVSRYLEFPKEAKRSRYHQVMGELVLLCTVMFSRFCMGYGKKKRQCQETIEWLYRFLIHGKQRAFQIHQIFEAFVSTPAEWNLILNGLFGLLSEE